MQPRANGMPAAAYPAPGYGYPMQSVRQVAAPAPMPMSQGVRQSSIRTMPVAAATSPTVTMRSGTPAGFIPSSSPRVFQQAPVSAGAPRYMASGQSIVRPVAASPVAASPAGASPAGYVAQPITSTALRPATGPVIRSMQVTPTTRPNVIAGPGYTQGAYEEKHKTDDPQLANLKQLRKTSGLKEVPVGEGLKSFKRAGGVDGKLSRQQFVDAYRGVLMAHSVGIPDEKIQHSVFDLFDRDDNGIVDLMELICGVSLLCSGSEDDKIHAVFDIFDENGDGFISMDEMYKFLASVFKVVLTASVVGVMNSMGVQVESPEDLASVTALECFKTSDLNHDGKLSVDEFKNWFYAPRNDPSFLFSPVRKLLQ